MDYSPPGSSVHGILQARILEWELFPSPEDHPDPQIKPGSPALQVYSLPSEPPERDPKWKDPRSLTLKIHPVCVLGSSLTFFCNSSKLLILATIILYLSDIDS